MCNNPAHQLINAFSGPIPNNRLPFVNPVAQKLAPFFLLPNSGPNTFVSTQNLQDNNDQFGIRVGYYISPNNVLNFRYMFSTSSVLEPLSTSGANVPGFPVGEDHRAQNFVAQSTHTFSRSVVGVARFSFLRLGRSEPERVRTGVVSLFLMNRN